LGRQLDGGTLAFLAIAHGAGKVHTINLSKGESAEESLNYEEIAKILNGPDHPPMPPYTGPKIVIADHKHFVETFLFALEHTPHPFDVEKIKEKEPGYRTPIESLVSCFQHLATVARNYDRTGYHFQVSPDFADHSFYFTCEDGEDKFRYNGGIILHKDWDKKTGEYLCNHRMQWSIHT
jgi:hypothetical protein